MIQSHIVRGITRMIRTGRRLVRMAVRQLVLIKIQTTITQAPVTKSEATKPEINQPEINQLVNIAIPASAVSGLPLSARLHDQAIAGRTVSTKAGSPAGGLSQQLPVQLTCIPLTNTYFA